MSNPVVLRFVGSDEDAAASDLAVRLRDLEFAHPHIVCSAHGLRIAEHLGPHRVTPPPEAGQEWAAELGSHAARADADVVVAVGGGRCIDLAKLAAARAGRPLVVVPTQLSHDGICSPVAVVPSATGRTESLGAVAPIAVYLSLPTLAHAPAEAARAGVGDLLANPWALRDWELAIERGLDDPHIEARALSEESVALIGDYLDGEARSEDPGFLGRLADALILSGRAMTLAGSSRPASGAEHEISHALDELHPGAAMHGAQVAFGCTVAAALYEEDVAATIATMKRLGLPHHPADLGLDADATVEVLLRAPDTRPGRFTILESVDLDAGTAHTLVKQIWGDS